MSRDVGRRVFLSLAIPLGAAAFVAMMLWAFSRVLLAVDKSIAPWVSLLFALNIMVGSALAAILRGRRSFALVIGMMVTVVLVAGVAAAFVGEQPVPSHVAEGGAHGEPGTAAVAASPTPAEQSPTVVPTGEPTDEATGEPTPEPADEQVPIAAENLQFTTDSLELPPETRVTIALDNQDTQPHNLSIYEGEGGPPIFQGAEIADPGTHVEYTFESPPPGEYYFQCDIHPTMNGTAVVG